MTTTAQAQQTVSHWPLARRVVSGFVQPGGPAMVARAAEGGGLEEGSRVVELAPGLGLTSELLLAHGVRTWTGVEPDATAAGHLRKALAGAGREVVEAPLGATGLQEGAASLVVADGLLSTLSGDDRAAALAEGARLLRAGGRLVILDVTPAADAPGVGAGRDALESAGIAMLEVGAWRAALEAAGLVVVGSLTGPVDLPAPPALMREAGPRLALRITREVATDASVRGPAIAGRDALAMHASMLRAVVAVGEMPLILGMRRPRR